MHWEVVDLQRFYEILLDIVVFESSEGVMLFE